MQMSRRDNVASSEISRTTIEKTVAQLVMVSRAEEACRLLGVDGVLAELVTINFLDDPLDYLAYDIAAAIRDAAEGTAAVQASMLAALVAELRLASLMVSRIDQNDLVERVLKSMEELE